ncbi:protein FAR1-RELATED SEQUENCE 5-like [Papaver somniferum]|uniref:protein FAR1-RELATED SEQUENCE 5-like n=1 Tax=Papaver somniferum TaxID=3469 RepID=UPI000E6F950C|nr:protein FAR1-RELATED SEQUENCE 5-like [Papaver somniferum]
MDVNDGEPQTENDNFGDTSEEFYHMTFNSFEEARDSYIEYGRNNGFDVRIRSTNKTRVRVDQVTSDHFVCSREGQKTNDTAQGINKKLRNTNTIQCGCKAEMRVLYSEILGKWRVTKFIDEHNHKFVSPEKRIRLRENRYMPEAAKI